MMWIEFEIDLDKDRKNFAAYLADIAEYIANHSDNAGVILNDKKERIGFWEIDEWDHEEENDE